MSPDPSTIHVLMGRVLAELPAIGKDDYNQQQKFHFRGIDAVLNALNPLLAKHGVFYVPEVVERQEAQRQTKGGTVMYVVNLHVRYRFYGPAGDYVEASAWGEGTDMGDKATNKAMTGAMKYMLFQVFAISTAEASDADAAPVEESTPVVPCPAEGCAHTARTKAEHVPHLQAVHGWQWEGSKLVPPLRLPAHGAPGAGSGEGVEPGPPPAPPSPPPSQAQEGGGAEETGESDMASTMTSSVNATEQPRPGPSKPAAAAPSARARRTTALMAGATQRYPDRQARLDWAADTIGRHITTFGELTEAEEHALLDALAQVPA